MRLSLFVTAAIDQALLSALNLLITYAFVKYAAKTDYGIYILLMTPLYLATGLQNALVLSPIVTVLPSMPIEKRDLVYRTSITYQIIFIAIASIFGGIFLAAYWQYVEKAMPMTLVLGFSAGVAGICTREAVRTRFYTTGQPAKALISDVVYATGVITIFFALIHLHKLTPSYALLGAGVAALWPLLFKIRNLFRLEYDIGIVNEFWSCGKWAIVGVLVAWINLSAYPLIVAIKLNAGSVAEINVARLFLMPVGLCATAWANLYRPQISAWFAGNEKHKIRELTLKSIAIGIASLLLYLAALSFTYSYIESVLGPKYAGLLNLIILWGVFFGFSLARGMLMATLMTFADGYRQLQGVGWYGLIISLGGLWYLSDRGNTWVVAVLIAVEVVQLLLIGTKVLRLWAKHEREKNV